MTIILLRQKRGFTMENKRLVIMLSILIGLELIQVIEKIVELVLR